MKTFGKVPSAQQTEQLKKSPYYRKKGFVFMGTKPSVNIGVQIAQEYIKSSKKERAPKIKIPVVFHTKKTFAPKPSQTLKMMWLGHAGLLIEAGGQRILVDPVFGQRPSPTQLLGPSKRFHPSPFNLKNLPAIDYIMITHNHYDHLDYDFISRIQQKNIDYIVPLGLSATLVSWGIGAQNIYELAWHQTLKLGGLQFTAVEAKHYSGRSLNDRNATFWNAYIIASPKQKIFISGDSGFIKAYKKIGATYGPFEVAAMAIGAYHRLWPDNHKTPEEAWQAKQDVQAHKILPVHWGTFDLALHHWDEPVERLIKAAKQQTNDLLLPKIGQWVNPNEDTKFPFWWRS